MGDVNVCLICLKAYSRVRYCCQAESPEAQLVALTAAKLKHLFGTKARSPATEHPPAINREAGSRHMSRTDCLEGNVDVTARGMRIGADFLVRFFGECGELALGKAPVLNM